MSAVRTLCYVVVGEGTTCVTLSAVARWGQAVAQRRCATSSEFKIRAVISSGKSE